MVTITGVEGIVVDVGVVKVMSEAVADETDVTGFECPWASTVYDPAVAGKVPGKPVMLMVSVPAVKGVTAGNDSV